MVKVASKVVNKTEKKLVSLLKDQHSMIEKLQVNYKEKLVASRDSLIDQINKIQAGIEE